MQIHKIKIWDNYADAILCERKTFEVRYNDRGYRDGDLLEFTVIDPALNEVRPEHPLHGKKYLVTYIHHGLGMEENYVIMAIKEWGE